MSGKLVILSGPSGVGKDTVIQRWKQMDGDVQRVVSYTTRAPREGEVDGIDYHFVSPEEFHQKASAGHFLEWKQVHDNFYATPLADMERMLIDGKTAVLKIDVQGSIDVMLKRPDAISIFLMPPSMDILEERLRSRGTDGKDVIERRLANARMEMSLADRYRHRVVNDKLDRAVAEIMEIVG